MISSKRQKSIHLLIFVVLGLLLYTNSLEVPLYLDDYRNISENQAIRLPDLSLAGINEIGAESPMPTRPVAYLSFALNYYLHQGKPFGYHLINIAIHCIAAIFLYLFVEITLRTPALHERFQDIRHPIAFWAILLWFAHPVQVNGVTYIVQRMTSMAAMFYIIAFYLFVKGRLAFRSKVSYVYFAGSCFSWFLALGSKEIAVTLPFFLFLHEWYFFQDCDLGWFRKRLPYVLGLFSVILAFVFLYLGTHPLEAIVQGYAVRPFTLNERLLTESRVFFFYLSLLLLPMPGRLSLEHDFAVSASLLQPPITILAIAGVGLLLFVAIAGARKHRLLSFAILFFLGNLVLESSVIPLELVFEHRLYLPAMLFFLPLSSFVFAKKKFRAAGTFVIAAVVVFLSAVTLQNNILWQDPVAFWRHNLKNAPQNARVYNNLGMALFERGELADSIKYLSDSVRINPAYALAHNNLGIALRHTGKINQALLHFEQALFLNPSIFEAHANLGAIYGERGDLDRSYGHLKEAIELNPYSAVAHNNIGNILQMKRRFDEAISHYNEALRLQPDYEDARFNRDIALRRSGRQR